MKTAYEKTKELIAEIKPKMSFSGENFEEWKIEARKKLSELLEIDKISKVEPSLKIEFERKIEGAKEIRFTFESEEGYRIPFHFWIPDGVEKPPVMICLQGHTMGMHISLGRVKYEYDKGTLANSDSDFCVRAIKEGFAAIAMEQRNFGECGGDEEGPHCYESALTNIIMGRTTIGERVWDVLRLIDIIESKFNDIVDTKTICLMGNSGGGTATAYTAALDDRIVLAIPSCAMCSFKDSIGTKTHCACNYVPHIAEFFDMGDIMAMAAPKYFIQVSGKEDRDFPINAAKEVFDNGKKAYQLLGISDKCTLVVGSAGHRFYSDDAWPFVHKYIGR